MGKWIIASNRLPFNYNANTKKLIPSSGGLVTAIRGIQTDRSVTWVGSCPKNVPQKLMTNLKEKKIQYSSPNIATALYEDYYNGFCNDVLWPILHYESELVKFKKANWKAYQQVNQIFAEHICKLASSDDIIWIHDFHLFLVPKMIKALRPELKIGFFLHVPFPSSEIYRQLPCRETILDSLIYSDLLGFHDYSYLRHFASSVYNLLGISSSLLEIKHHHHTCKLGVYPVSIDTQAFQILAKSNQTKKNIQHFNLKIENRINLLGIDRLDYTKGLIYKLKAFKKLLEQNPHFIGKVQLTQVAVPSRTNVKEYISLRHEVEKLISEINGTFSTLNYIPIRYIFKSIEIHELMALYRSSNVLVVTSKRDGMNLVCLEYIAAQSERNPGVVVLSEFAGAASTLGHALQINPRNIQETYQTLQMAIEMPLIERKNRHKIMLNYLKNYTATDWANSFINHLIHKQTASKSRAINICNKDVILELKHKVKNKKKFILLDYDGTLVPIKQRPEEAILDTNIKNKLKHILKQKHTEFIIVSGRPIHFLQQQFKGLPVHIAGEHGGKFFDFHLKKWQELVTSNKSQWYQHALNIISTYTNRTPNSFIEKKNFAITWHYRNSPVDFADFQARKLVIDLEAGLHNLPVSVITGKKVVEVKALEANKGYFASWFYEHYTSKNDIIFALGDDRTDEDMFESLQQKAITIKIGENDDITGLATHYIEQQERVMDILEKILS